jgi:hypothetical protein
MILQVDPKAEGLKTVSHSSAIAPRARASALSEIEPFGDDGRSNATDLGSARFF